MKTLKDFEDIKFPQEILKAEAIKIFQDILLKNKNPFNTFMEFFNLKKGDLIK